MPRSDAERLLKRLDRIAENPMAPHAGVRQLTGAPGQYRVRQGDWRAIYAVKGGNVIVGQVGHRKEVYR
jgi:mRNA interferase RelE/StbE